jgi:hypothetical protein
MIIELALEHELEISATGIAPTTRSFERLSAISKLGVHHPKEDLVFGKLENRDPAAAAKSGDLAREHQRGPGVCAR